VAPGLPNQCTVIKKIEVKLVKELIVKLTQLIKLRNQNLRGKKNMLFIVECECEAHLQVEIIHIQLWLLSQ